MGPTASGKTELAVELVRRLPMEIISVDSALVYRGMDIGTAKPSPAVRAEAPHRLIDICDPEQPYSAAQFRDDALKAMAEITAAGRIPLLVGGTMLYFRALSQGLSPLPAADPTVRRRLEEEAAECGWRALHERLAEVDPEAAARINANDPQRIQRALEVYELTGVVLSELTRRGERAPLPYRLVKLAVAPQERSVLHERIARRFEAMINEGLVEEVRRLRARPGLHRDLPAVRAVGYRQVWDYLEGRCDYEQMIKNGIVATRRLAKRQLTWLRSEADLVWLDSLSPNRVGEALKVLREAGIVAR